LDAVAGSGSVEIARMLIARGARPDGPALYAAANSGHAEVVKLFIEHGADLKYTESTWQRTVLHTAHSAQVVKVLVQAGMDIEVKNKIGETPLHEAAHFAPHEVVVALLELGADPHAVSKWKKTPLEMAEDRDRPGKEEILQTLRTAMSKVKPKKSPPDKK
jgi:cytohesin